MSADEKRRYVASVAERIAWTTGFSLPIDKHVLAILSTFGNYLTGEDCHPRIKNLAARARLPRRSVQRALQRLEAEQWITGRRWHRHATSYQIDLDRLATHPTGAKIVLELSATGGAQESPLRATGGAQDSDLSAMGGAQEFSFATVNPLLRATGGAPISSTYGSHKEEEISIPDLISRTESAPPLRAGRPVDADEEPKAQITVPDWGDAEVRHAATLSAVRNADLQADRGDHPNDAAAGSRGPGSDQAPACETGLSLPERPNSSGAEGSVGDRGAPLGPSQATLGPLDVNPPPSTWQRLAHTIRTALADATRRKSG